jgi:hypothetical protein
MFGKNVQKSHVSKKSFSKVLVVDSKLIDELYPKLYYEKLMMNGKRTKGRFLNFLYSSLEIQWLK